MIYQLYKKQVEAWKERFTHKGAFGETRFNHFMVSNYTKDDPIVPEIDNETTQLLSSRHKDTIELIEAIIKEVEGMDRYDMNGYPNVGYCIERVEDEEYIKREDLLTKLQAQKKLIEKEI